MKYKLISFLCIVFSLLAIAYCALSSIGASSIKNSVDEPYFVVSFWTQLAISILFAVALGVVGFKLWRDGMRYRVWLLLLFIVEILYLFAGGAIWAYAPDSYAMSHAAATGIAGGGTIIKWLILFPVWALIILFWPLKKST